MIELSVGAFSFYLCTHIKKKEEERMGVFSVPVTIGVNEEEIAKRIEENVEKQVIKEITNKVEEIIYNKNGYSYFDQRKPLQRLIDDRVDKILDENKDAIVKLAAEKLADKLSRTKAVKEAAAKKIEEEL